MQEDFVQKQKLAAMQAEIENLRQELAILRTSRSWYLTKPLRFLHGRLRETLFADSASLGSQTETTMRTATSNRPVQDAPNVAGEQASTAHAASTEVVTQPVARADEVVVGSDLVSDTRDAEPTSASYVLNDGAYWDAYVKHWEAAPENRELRCLGTEWKNEEVFLAFLAKYSVQLGTALEIGCGGGRITREAVGLFGEVRAGDVSPEMLRKCEESIHARNLTLQKLDGFTLSDIEDRSIDVVYSHDVFVHFSSLQVYSYLEEIRRVLKHGGIGLISFYNFFVSFDLFKEMSMQFRASRMFPPHMRVHFITEPMIRTMLEDLDLEEIEVDRSGFLIVAFRRKPAVP